MSSSFERFEELQREGKRLAAEGRLHESLHKFELARKIKETSKILSRIQKLKDVIGEEEQSFRKKSSGSFGDSEKSSGILNQIQNIEVINKKSSSSADDQTPGKLKSFNELKSRAIGLSYEGKFNEALHCFREARKLRDCPDVKKYIKEMETLVSKYPKKLEEFQHLTDTGKKLASAGKHAESLQNLKKAYAVCPSPAVSRMIKKLESENPLPEVPVFSSPTFEKKLPTKNSVKDAEITSTIKSNQVVLNSSKSKESQFGIAKANSGGSSGSDFSLASGSQSTDPGDLSPGERERFKHLYGQAKELAREGQLQMALDKLEKARKICPAERILKRIADLKEHMKLQETSDEMIEVSDGFSLYHEIYNNLYPYQREGVAWMWKLFKMKKGGVLGDDMGLGKTFQVIAFLSGLIDADLIKYALIVMPVSLLPNWEKEFKKWSPGINVCQFHGTSKRERERSLFKVQKRGHVILTSYGMLLNALPLLTEFEGKAFVWDYVILDEGHKIKNPTKTTKAVHAIPSKHRLVLTGTPIQNNLLELWALYDFVHQGTLLGSLKTFKMQYENTISRAREKDSSAGEKLLGTQMAENLKMLIKPYFLRRTKAEIWKKKPEDSEGMDDLEKDMNQMRISDNKLNSRKNDLIVWIYMAEPQSEIYRSFLHSEAVKTILVSKRSPLVELTTLKKICDHPRLLSQRACLQLGLNGEIDEEDLQRELSEESSYSSSIANVTDDVLMAESGKMKFLIELLENLRSEGHRTLVFSLSRKILDMINRILLNRKWKVLRIDGTISKIDERERRIQLFQNDPSYSVFLLTTQVGGVGITLTAADRVVIYDPSWNPATDAQAVDRVYRIGQQNNVIVYRLITCGTVEEKIYRRQIFKDSITKQATGSADPYRYFSKQELRELFTFENPYHSATQVQLSQLHSQQRQSDTQLDGHIAFLHSLNIFGISDHDLMFSREIQDSTEDNDEAAVSHDYIKKQVAAAQVLIQTEASVVAEGIRLAGTFSRPYAENIPVPKKKPESVSQISEAMPSVNTASKFKEHLPPFTIQSIFKKNTPIHSPELLKIENYDLGKGDVFNVEKRNARSSRISPNYGQISRKSGDDFIQKDIEMLSNISNISTPPLSDRCNISSKNPYHVENNRVKSTSPRHSELHKSPVNATNSISSGLPPYFNNISKHASPTKSNRSKTSSPEYVGLQKSFGHELNISNPGTPPFQNRTSSSGNGTSKHASFTESDRRKDMSLKFSELLKNSPLKTINCDYNSDINTDIPVIEINSDSDDAEEKNKSSVNQSIETSKAHDYALDTNDVVELDSGDDVKIGNSYTQLNQSVVTTDVYDPDMNADVGDVELNSGVDVDNHSEKINEFTDGNQPVEILEETSKKSASSSESIYHSTNEDEPQAQSSPNAETASCTDLPECIVSPVRATLSSQESEQPDGTALETSNSDGISSPIVSNKPSYIGSEYSSGSKGEEENSFNGQGSESAIDSDESQEAESKIHSEVISPSRSRYSSAGLGSAASANGSLDSFMGDLSFDDKPQSTQKRKSCVLPKPFVASDSDFSCPNSPSKEDDNEVLASSESEEEEDDEEVVSEEDSDFMVPSSIPNSPAPRVRTLAESPVVRRITPLKVRKSLCPPPDQAFAQALANSPVLKPLRYFSDSEEDSPVNCKRPAVRRNVLESSDED